MLKVAKYYNTNKIYLTCDFDNIASSKTIEKLGAKLLEEIKPPKDYVFYNENMPKQISNLIKIQ